jgi:hypothetical protein
MRVLARQDGPSVLAGHSFSGMIVTDAGTQTCLQSSTWPPARRMPAKITQTWPGNFPRRLRRRKASSLRRPSSPSNQDAG